MYSEDSERRYPILLRAYECKEDLKAILNFSKLLNKRPLDEYKNRLKYFLERLNSVLSRKDIPPLRSIHFSDVNWEDLTLVQMLISDIEKWISEEREALADYIIWLNSNPIKADFIKSLKEG